MRHKHKPGVLNPFIKDFIQIRHNLGYKSTSMEISLRAFDTFAYQAGLREIEISRDLAEEWCKRRKGEANDTWSHRINFLRQFSIYLLNMGYNAHTPYKPPSKRDHFSPYIFSSEEITKIFEAADSLKLYDKHRNTCLVTIPLLLRMLYATGIRVGEALNLNTEDVDIERNCLTIRGGKNGKDRVVPFSDSLGRACCQYLRIRDRFPRHCKKFFAKPDGSKCILTTYYYWWNEILRMCDIRHRGKTAGPRIHDLRHTFCVNAMHKMSLNDKDIYYTLPILSTYIGHSSIASTDYYVRMTSEMYPELINKAESICSYIYPIIKNR